MLDVSLLEQAIAWTVSIWGEEQLRLARAAVEAQIAPLVAGESDYEPSISHFFERYLCAAPPGDAAPRVFALSRSEFCSRADPHASTDHSASAPKDQLIGWAHSHRSLYHVREKHGGRLHLQDLLWGGRYACVETETEIDLALGDRMDARLVPLAGSLFLSPGRLFHPRETHAAMDALLAQAPEPRDERLLDALLRMRASFLRFESIRAEHVYRAEALAEPSLIAPWARRPS